MHPREQILLKVYWKYHNFRPRKCIWKKCRLENGGSDMLRMTFDQFCCHRNQTPLPRPPYTSNSLFISYTCSSLITDSKLPMCNVLRSYTCLGSGEMNTIDAIWFNLLIFKSWIVIQKLYGGIHSLIIPVVGCKHYKSPVVSPEKVPAMRRLCVFFAVSPDKLFGIVML